MTVEEFKKQYPEHEQLEGNELWDAMTQSMLRQQSGNKIIKSTLPFWKKYKLRYLFYRKLPNWKFGKNDHSATERCIKCKKGVANIIGMMYLGRMIGYCPHGCGELIKESNTSWEHKLFMFKNKISSIGWKILDFLHIVRSSHSGRYDIFGDEQSYIAGFTLDTDTGKQTIKFKKRKWYEYIFIRKY